MDWEALTHMKFYHEHKDIIESQDREEYDRLNVKYFIALVVGITLTPASVKLCRRTIEGIPKPLAGVVTVIAGATPMLGLSYLMKKYYLNPHLEYIFKKYSFTAGEFDRLISKDN